MPLPPGDLPVARPGDHDHRLGEEREREDEREQEACRPTPVEPEVAERGQRVERETDRGERQLPAVELLGGEGLLSGGSSASETIAQTAMSPKTSANKRGACRTTAARAGAELDRGSGSEDSREQEPDRRRELEAGVLPEQDAGRRERVQAEEACARDERERDEEEASVAASACRHADGVAERGRDRGGREHEPEVRRLVLPALVDDRPGEQEPEEDERRGDEHEQRCDSHRLGFYHPRPSG